MHPSKHQNPFLEKPSLHSCRSMVMTMLIIFNNNVLFTFMFISLSFLSAWMEECFVTYLWLCDLVPNLRSKLWMSSPLCWSFACVFRFGLGGIYCKQPLLLVDSTCNPFCAAAVVWECRLRFCISWVLQGAGGWLSRGRIRTGFAWVVLPPPPPSPSCFVFFF